MEARGGSINAEKDPELESIGRSGFKKRSQRKKSASYDEKKVTKPSFSVRVERHYPRCADPSLIVQQEPDESVFRMSRVRILVVSVWCFGTKISQTSLLVFYSFSELAKYVYQILGTWILCEW